MMFHSRFPNLTLGFVFFAYLLFLPCYALAQYQPPVPPSPGEPENGEISFYEPRWDSHISFADGKGEKQDFHVRGEKWEYRTVLGEGKKEQQQAVRDWLNTQNISIVADVPEHVLARTVESKGERLTYHFKISRDRTDVAIYLERHLSLEKPVSMTIGEEGRKGFNVWWDHDGTYYQSMIVEFEKGLISASGKTISQFNDYQRSVKYKRNYRIEHGTKQVIFDIPQYAGPYKWRIRSRSKTPQSVTIRLIKGPALPELEDGPGLGAIRVRNLPTASVRVNEEWDANVNHPDFKKSSIRADRTPQGDAIFWVPSGYWQVNGAPSKKDGPSSATAHMIPVHEGRITDLDWPRSLSGIFSPRGIGKLEIIDTREHENRGEIDISLMELDDVIVPKAELVNCYEGGLAGKVVSVEPLKSSLNVVLLLDSSGSMKGSMTKALDAVKTFVKLFPETARITVVDFDTKPKKLAADDRSSLLKALDGVHADGATALYDSILLGLEELENRDRSALVVFTDGVDANWNDTGPGSKATKPEVIKAVKNQKNPIYAIGFGNNPDMDTLTRVASVSGGIYYEAHDKETLDTVFTKISKNLGRQYRVTYERPKAVGLSDVPVMAVVVDNSGSMDRDPSRKGCDFRIQKVREILKSFRQSLPEEFLVQLLTFSNDVRVDQVITSETVPMLRGLSLMQGNGGTNILDSIRAALETLKAVPSTRRYLVYLADAAMKVDKKVQKQMDIYLSSLKDEGIQSLFVGVVDTDEDRAFENAAAMSGGRYVISTDLEQINAAFSALADTLTNETEEKVKRLSLQLTLADRNDKGRNRLFSAGKFVDFPPLPQSEKAFSPEALSWSIGEPLTVYDSRVAATISGGDPLAERITVSKRIPLDIRGQNGEMQTGVKGRNEAMELSALEMIFLSRLRGIDAPNGYRYLVLPLQLTNLLKPQKVAVFEDGSQHPAAWMAGSAAPQRYEEKIPPYLIPDLTRHLFLGWNNKITLSVSPVTWLCEQPLLFPGERALKIPAKETISGATVFLVPDTEMTQASLHFYDVNYGHVDIPLTGVMSDRPAMPSELPTSPAKDLGSSFALTLSNVTDHTNIAQINAEDGYVFRIIEGYLTSKIQALLAINPADRFSYHLPTERGDYVFDLHSATKYVPMGFYQPTMMAPGSRNVIRLAFRLPKKLADRKEKGYLFADVYGGGVRLDLADASAVRADLKTPDASGKGVEIFVNDSGMVKELVAGLNGNVVAVDITLKDLPDSSHTRLGPLVVLKKKGDSAADEQEYRQRHKAEFFKVATKRHRGMGDFGHVGVGKTELAKVTGASRASYIQDKLIFGLDEKSIIFDGQTSRGVMLFRLPKEEKIEEWEIGSLVLDDMALPLNNVLYNDKNGFATRLDITDTAGESFWRKLEEEVEKLQAQRKATGYERPGNVSAKPVDLDTADLGKRSVDVPGSCSPGAAQLKALSREKDVWEIVSGLDWIPGSKKAWGQRYAPEAVLTQGWGDPSDLAVLAERLLRLQGRVTTRAEVEPTNRGRKALAQMAGGDKIKINSLPAVRYTDNDGKERFMVLPWCKDLAAMEDLVKWDGAEDEPRDSRQKSRVRVELEMVPISSQSGGTTRDAAAALAGGGAGKTKKVIVLDETYMLDTLSLDALDIGYTEVREDGHPTLKCLMDGPEGRVIGEKGVILDSWTVINEVIYVAMDRNKYMVQQPVGPENPITGRFHILSLNAPDMIKASASKLEKIRSKIHKEASEPDGLSTLRWYGRSTIDRFITAQTKFEAHLAKKLKLSIGRTHHGRCILVTVSRPAIESDPSTRVDLLWVNNDIHANQASETQKAMRAFNILAGMAAARFEAAAIPGGGMGMFELWANSPEGTQLAYVDRKNKREFIDMLKEKGYPEPLTQRLNTCRDAILFPTNPSIINDRARWGWLEIDPKTFRVISRLDNGAAGALASKIIGDLYQQATSYLLGALVGIDASLWGVAAFSLELEDYDEICEKAYAFTSGLFKRFSIDAGPVGWDIGGSPDIGLGKFGRFVNFKLNFKGVQPSGNMLGFKNGYKDAVEFYFSE